MDVTKKLAATDAGSGPTTGKPGPMAGDQKGQHPGTSVISKETEGKATSPQDVQRQSGVKTEASHALERARALDTQGKEAECMNEEGTPNNWQDFDALARRTARPETYSILTSRFPRRSKGDLS